MFLCYLIIFKFSDSALIFTGLNIQVNYFEQILELNYFNIFQVQLCSI